MPRKTLFVARIPRDAVEEDLLKHFSAIGTLRSVKLVRDVLTGRSRGYAFVEYERSDDLKRAISVGFFPPLLDSVIAVKLKQRDGKKRGVRHEILGREVVVDVERGRQQPGWIPRRFGGGLGGQKQSGQLRFGGPTKPFLPPRF